MPRYKPQQPLLIDPAGVRASPYPCAMANTTDASRARRGASGHQLCCKQSLGFARPYRARRHPSLEMGGGTAADLMALQEAEVQRWRPVIKASGFRAD